MSNTHSLFETPRTLEKATRILEGVEATALGSMAQMLLQAAESLSRRVRELREIYPDEWLTFERVAKGEILKCCLTEQDPANRLAERVSPSDPPPLRSTLRPQAGACARASPRFATDEVVAGGQVGELVRRRERQGERWQASG